MQISNCEVISILSDVTNFNMVKSVISENKIDTIYHAALISTFLWLKKILLKVFNNVIGTYNVAICAHECEVENMVLIDRQGS